MEHLEFVGMMRPFFAGANLMKSGAAFIIWLVI